MLNKRVENGYVGIAFPLSFGAVSMVLVWWLRWGGSVPPTGAAWVWAPAAGGGTAWPVAGHSPSRPGVLLRAWPAGARLSPDRRAAFSSDRDRGRRVLPGRHGHPAGLSWSQALA